jgi:hypothetical protein
MYLSGPAIAFPAAAHSDSAPLIWHRRHHGRGPHIGRHVRLDCRHIAFRREQKTEQPGSLMLWNDMVAAEQFVDFRNST